MVMLDRAETDTVGLTFSTHESHGVVSVGGGGQEREGGAVGWANLTMISHHPGYVLMLHILTSMGCDATQTDSTRGKMGA